MKSRPHLASAGVAGPGQSASHVAGHVKAERREKRKGARAPRLPKAVVSFCPRRALAGLDLPLPPHAARLVLPFPPADLNPNARAHRGKKSRVARQYKAACWAETLAQFGVAAGWEAFFGIDRNPQAEIRVAMDLFPPDRARRDDDNAEAAFKAGRDGVAGAMKVDDARFVVTRRLHKDPRGCVVLTFQGSAS